MSSEVRPGYWVRQKVQRKNMWPAAQKYGPSSNLEPEDEPHFMQMSSCMGQASSVVSSENSSPAGSSTSVLGVA